MILKQRQGCTRFDAIDLKGASHTRASSFPVCHTFACGFVPYYNLIYNLCFSSFRVNWALNWRDPQIAHPQE